MIYNGHIERLRKNATPQNPFEWLKNSVTSLFGISQTEQTPTVTATIVIPFKKGKKPLRMLHRFRYPDFFRDLSSHFAQTAVFPFSITKPKTGKGWLFQPYAIVDDIDDLSKVSAPFLITEETRRFLRRCYSQHYTFFVCLVDDLSLDANFAWFVPRDDDTSNRLWIPGLSPPETSPYRSDWNHVVYSVADNDDGSTETYNGAKLSVRVENCTKKMVVDKDKFPFDLDMQHLRRRTITGYHPNGDIFF